MSGAQNYVSSPGGFPRGDPETYFVEPDRLDSGRQLQRMADALPSWQQQALCREFDLDLWYPTRGQPNQPALAICRRCPVRSECLADALDDEALDWGIRGGACLQTLDEQPVRRAQRPLRA